MPASSDSALHCKLQVALHCAAVLLPAACYLFRLVGQLHAFRTRVQHNPVQPFGEPQSKASNFGDGRKAKLDKYPDLEKLQLGLELVAIAFME